MGWDVLFHVLRAIAVLGAAGIVFLLGWRATDQLCEASGISARIEAEAVPVIEGAFELAGDQRCVAGGTCRNSEHAEVFTEWASEVNGEERVLLTDAMTSGGLLIAVESDCKRRSTRQQDRLADVRFAWAHCRRLTSQICPDRQAKPAAEASNLGTRLHP